MLFRLLALSFAIAMPGDLLAQVPPRALGRVSGRVLDSASGRPPIKTSVCAFVDTGTVRPAPRCGIIDSLGFYQIDSVVPGRRLLSVQCATKFGPLTDQLAFERLVVADSEIHRDWIVPTRGCDTRIVRRVTGVFRGHYTPGFESSAFVPCPADAWFLPSDSLGSEPFYRRAWVTGPLPAAPRKWPDAPRDGFGNPRYYVEWHGIIVGPGSYGHMGVSPFELRVDSVFVVRAAQSNDCRQTHKSASPPAG